MQEGAPPKPPSHPRYEILEEIARGGMGVVYRVKDLDLNRVLALKWLAHPHQANYYARFLEEVQVTAQLDHPSIVPIMDLGFDETDDQPFYTMRYVKGRDLGAVMEWVHEGRAGWNLSRLIEILIKVCQALAHAHGKGVLHRDLKPSNIMVGDLGEVYVMDWGLARMLGKADRDVVRSRLGSDSGALDTIEAVRESVPTASIDAPLVTTDGAVIGTPAYMPPEQAEGRLEEVDHLADVYALGAILYQMLSGHPPYMPIGSSVTAREVLTELRERPPARVRRLDAKLPQELVSVCDKSMARDRRERYGSALALSEDLQAYLDGRVVKAHETGAWIELKKWVARNRAVAAIGAVFVVAILAFIGLQMLSMRRLDRANADLTATLADSFTNRGFAAETPERAALWFTAASALQEPGSVAAQASRTRFRQWSHLGFEPLRFFHSQHDLEPEELYFHPEAPLVILEGLEQAEIWDLRGQERPLFPGERFRCAAWNPHHDLLAVADWEGEVSLIEGPDYDFGNRQPLVLSDAAVACLEWDLVGERLGIGGEHLHVWQWQDQEWLGPPRLHASPVAAITFHANRRYVATASGQEARVFDLYASSPEPLHTPFVHYRWTEHRARVFQPVFMGMTLMTNGGDHPRWLDAWRRGDYATRYWDLNSGEETKRVPVHPIQVSPGERFLHTNDAILDCSTHASVFNLFGLADRGTFHPDGSLFVGWREQGTVIDLRRREMVGVIGRGFYNPLSVRAIGFAPHGRYLGAAFGTQGGGSDVVIFKTWRSPHQDSIVAHRGGNGRVALSENGLFAATVGVPQSVLEDSNAYLEFPPRVHDVRTGEPVGPGLVTPGEPLAGAFVDRDQAIVLCHGAEREERLSHQYQRGFAQLWDWKRGEPISEAVRLPSEPRDALRSPDGTWVAILAHHRALVRLEVPSMRVTILADSQGVRKESSDGGDAEERLSFASDGTLIYQGLSGETHLWSPEASRSGGTPQVISTGTGRVVARAVSEKSIWLVARGEHQPIMIDRNRLDASPIALEGRSLLSSIAWNEHNDSLLVGGQDGLAHLYRATGGGSFQRLLTREHSGVVTASHFFPHQPWILTHAEGEGLSIWEPTMGLAVGPPIVDTTHGRQQVLRAASGERLLVNPFSHRSLSMKLSAYQPNATLSVDAERALAAVKNHGTINDRGGFVKDTKDQWEKRWQRFRNDYPGYHDGQLSPLPGKLASYHRERAIQSAYERSDLIAYHWHLQRWSKANPESRQAWVWLLDAGILSVDDERVALLLQDPVWGRDGETLALIVFRQGEASDTENERRSLWTLAKALHQRCDPGILYHHRTRMNALQTLPGEVEIADLERLDLPGHCVKAIRRVLGRN